MRVCVRVRACVRACACVCVCVCLSRACCAHCVRVMLSGDGSLGVEALAPGGAGRQGRKAANIINNMRGAPDEAVGVIQ